jgi:hypothetical protein
VQREHAEIKFQLRKLKIRDGRKARKQADTREDDIYDVDPPWGSLPVEAYIMNH